MITSQVGDKVEKVLEQGFYLGTFPPRPSSILVSVQILSEIEGDIIVKDVRVSGAVALLGDEPVKLHLKTDQL